MNRPSLDLKQANRSVPAEQIWDAITGRRLGTARWEWRERLEGPPEDRQPVRFRVWAAYVGSTLIGETPTLEGADAAIRAHKQT